MESARERAVAYNEPNINIIMMPTFSLVFSCVFQIIGMGRMKRTKSEIQLREP